MGLLYERDRKQKAEMSFIPFVNYNSNKNYFCRSYTTDPYKLSFINEIKFTFAFCRGLLLT
jgi:hypothetical protein